MKRSSNEDIGTDHQNSKNKPKSSGSNSESRTIYTTNMVLLSVGGVFLLIFISLRLPELAIFWIVINVLLLVPLNLFLRSDTAKKFVETLAEKKMDESFEPKHACFSCGWQNPKSNNYCYDCGTKLDTTNGKLD